MEIIKRLVLACFLITIWEVAAAEPLALVVEAKGANSATLEGKTSSLHTLQTVTEQSKVTVPAQGRLRLVYLRSGRKESISGPLSFVLTQDGATQLHGSGRLETTRSDVITPVLPRDQKLRELGRSVEAQTRRTPLELLETVSSPTPAPAEGDSSDTVRTSKPVIRNISPVFRWVRSIQKVSWSQGRAPFAVTLTRDDGMIELALPLTQAREIVFPELSRGHTYTLTVKDDTGSVGREEFYILSSEEDRQLREEKRELLSGLSDRRETLIAQVAFFEARGLLQEALPLAEEAVRRAPNDVGVWAALGRLQLQLGLDGDAEQSLLQAVGLETPRPRR